MVDKTLKLAGIRSNRMIRGANDTPNPMRIP